MFSFNQTDLLADESSYSWTVWCNDSLGNGGFAPFNYSFYIDTKKPNISLSAPTGIKSSRTNIHAIWSVSDYSLSSCIYNVMRGVNVEISNTSIDCSLNTTTFDVTLDADFVFNFYATDKAGNTAHNSTSFTVDTTTTASVVTGGGGGSSPIIQCTSDDDCKAFGEKYVCIQNYCIYQEKEPVCNYNGICEPERGENFLNCGDEYVNDSLVIKGDCNPFRIHDLSKIAFSSRGFLWTVFILFILGIVYLNQQKPNSFSRKLFKKARHKYKRWYA